MVNRKAQEVRRTNIITIKGWIDKTQKADREVEPERLILEVMSKFNVSDRTAKELIKIAKYELEQYKVGIG